MSTNMCLRSMFALVVASALAGCYQSAQQVKQDPSQPHSVIVTSLPAKDTFQLIEAGLTRCKAGDNAVAGAFVDASQTGEITLSSGPLLVSLIEVQPVEKGSRVTVYPNVHRAKQERAWPELIRAWVDEGRRDFCFRDALRG